MAKQKKSNHSVIPPVPREAIAAVRCEEDFIELLRRELEWPIPMNVQRLADVAIPHDLQQDFGFKPEEDRIAVSRLLNLSEDQPWGVFLFEFKTKRPYLSHLRRLLRLLGSQRIRRQDNPIWDRNDLLFICTPDWIQFQFVHFSGEKPESAVISTFGWKGPDDPFLHTLCKHNLPRLRMPQPKLDGGYDAETWRGVWRDAFSIKPVTDEFYSTLKDVFDAVQAGVKGLSGEDRRFFAELVVNRMVFLKFVEKKGWLDDDQDYLYNRFQKYGDKNYWKDFLCDFFFEGLCEEKDQRSEKVNELLGDVPFLNAELFAKSKPPDGWDDDAVDVENSVFDLLFDKLLNPYNFTVCETSPLEVEVAFNQDLLGYGYEELIADQHGQGAYYTHPTEVNLMCRESLRAFLEGRCPEMDKELIGKLVYAELTNADPVSEKDAMALYRALHNVTVVDPALGSGTFPVAMMKHLFLALRTLGGYLNKSSEFEKMLEQDEITDPNDAFALKLHIIERSIYGCDIDYFAVQIAKLRFWIELMVDCDKPEALPNFKCKLVVGDALVSIVGTDIKGNLITLEDLLGHGAKSKSQGKIIHFIGKQAVEKLAKLKREYFKVRDPKKRKSLEDQIDQTRDELLLSVGVRVDKIKRTDKHVLWQIDFAEIFSGSEPGFDIAIANPPYLRHELIDSALKEFSFLLNKDLLRAIYSELVGAPFNGKSDIYIYFYFRALSLLKSDGGVQTFICSNSWLDVGYGSQLQNFVLNNAMVHAIIESSTTRSFAQAAINTIISVICTQKSGNGCFLPARFLRVNQSLSTLPSQSLRSTTTTGSEEGRNYRLISMTNKELSARGYSKEGKYVGFKWGAFYLRAPSLFLDVVKKYSRAMCQIGEIAQVRFGIKTGANEFFFVDQGTIDQWRIESRFLVAAIKSPREASAICINENTATLRLFICPQAKSEIKNTQALKYIEWGESMKFDKRPSTANRGQWYSLDLPRHPPDINCNYQVHEVMRFFVADGGFWASNNFHAIWTDYPYSLAAAANCSLAQLWISITGRTNLGDGLLKVEGYEAAAIPVIKPTLLDENECKRILKRSKLLDLCGDDRRTLDEYIAHVLGIGKTEQEDISQLLRAQVEARIGKARSV